MRLYSKISLIYALWFIYLLTVLIIGYYLLDFDFPWLLNLKTINPAAINKNFLESLANWDGEHFTVIASAGYRELFQQAFFPVYPVLIYLTQKLIGNFIISGLIISTISSFAGTILFYKTALMDFSVKRSLLAVIFLLIFPTSFYFLTAYSESLFFFFAIATFYFARKNNILPASIMSAFASGTRVAGLAVVLGLLIEVKIWKGINKKNWYVLFSPLGLLLYCIFSYFNTGNPLYFIEAELHWQRYITFPILGIIESLRQIISGGIVKENLTVIVDFLMTCFGAVLIFRSFRFLRASYAWYGLLSILIPLLTPSLSSMPRFLLPIFPIFLVLAKIKNDKILIAYFCLSAGMLLFLAVLFIKGYWVS